MSTESAFERSREVRIGLVMYGGVSLAIYINGVAQELLKMCRATAEKGKADVQETTESVYRKISFLLSDKKLLDEFVKAFETGNEAEIARIDAELENTKSENVLKTRFVVDVLTGTSAGGTPSSSRHCHPTRLMQRLPARSPITARSACPSSGRSTLMTSRRISVRGWSDRDSSPATARPSSCVT